MPGTLVNKIGFPNGREFVVVIHDILYEPVDYTVNAASGGLSHGRARTIADAAELDTMPSSMLNKAFRGELH